MSLNGRTTPGVPYQFRVHTPTGEFYLFRSWDWYWQINWMMSENEWDTFLPQPNIRHFVVEDFIKAALQANLYVPHVRERKPVAGNPFPRTWRSKTPLLQVPFLGEEDFRFEGYTKSLQSVQRWGIKFKVDISGNMNWTNI